MLKIIVLSLCLIATNSVIANTRFSLEASLAENTVGNPIGSTISGGQADYNLGLGAAVGVDFFSNRIAQLNLMVGYLQRGYRSSTNYSVQDSSGNFVSNSSLTEGITLDYVVFRPSVGFKIPLHFAKLTISSGPYIGIMLGGHYADYNGSTLVGSGSLPAYYLNPFDYGLNTAVGMEFLSTAMLSPYFKIQYDFGFASFIQHINLDHRSFILSVGVLY